MSLSPSSKRRLESYKTKTSLSEVIGDSSQRGKPAPLSQLLCLLDVTAGYCAHIYSNTSVVTGCFGLIDILAQVNHGDIVTASALVLAVGTRSLLIQIDAYVDCAIASTPSPPRWHLVTALTTFVAHSSAGSLIPLPTSNDLDIALSTRLKRQRKVLISPPTSSSDQDLADGNGCTRISHIRDTHITTTRYFMPMHLNHAGIIFGGTIFSAV